MTEQTGNSKPNEAEGLAFPLSGNEKLIEWARSGNHLATRPGLVLELADALEAAEKAFTPTDSKPVAYGIYGRVTGNLKYVQVMDAHEVVEQSEFYDVVPLFAIPAAHGQTVGGNEREARHRYEAEILLRDIREAGYVFEKAHAKELDALRAAGEVKR